MKEMEEEGASKIYHFPFLRHAYNSCVEHANDISITNM